jgi:hypothetical protein
MEYESLPNRLRMVLPGHDLYVNYELFSVPEWMPNLSIDDNGAVHESLVTMLPLIAVGSHEINIVPDRLWRTVITIWQRRLPLYRDNLWPMMEAHGVSRTQKDTLMDFFDFGIKVLTLANGRPAIKRKRIPAMSQGRYLTNARRASLRVPNQTVKSSGSR